MDTNLFLFTGWLRKTTILMRSITSSFVAKHINGKQSRQALWAGLVRKGYVRWQKRFLCGAGFFRDAYKNNTLVASVRMYINHLFGEEGLVVINADVPELKQIFTPVIKEDLFSHTPCELVSRDSAKINALGYPTQVNCRQINNFYLDDGIRERIEHTGKHFRVLNTNFSFAKDEMQKLIDDQPGPIQP